MIFLNLTWLMIQILLKERAYLLRERWIGLTPGWVQVPYNFGHDKTTEKSEKLLPSGPDLDKIFFW